MTVLDTSLDVAALFVRQARATPNAVALEDQHRSLTYAELEAETASLANRLAAGKPGYGVGRDVLVGVLMGRCAENVVASLAALRAGGAFLVLELAYPNNLLADVIKDAKPAVIVTLRAHAHRVKNSNVPVVILDDDDKEQSIVVGAKEEKKRPADDDVDRLAFVCYSSGTTGRPKGIANPHRAAVGSYSLRFGVSDLNPGDRVACNVFFVWEMLRPLLRGATTVAVPDVVSYDPEALVTFLSDRKITDTLMTSTLLDIVMARHDADVGSLARRLSSLRSLWLNGEVVSADLCRKARAALPQHTRLLNVYSTSETHEVAAGELHVGDGMSTDICPVGRPLLEAEDETLILAPNGDDVVAHGEVGELCVGGPLLARGYLNLPEVTARSFFTRRGQRIYRTGDAARRMPDGRLEIKGRIGGMIKTRGYTVQPGAVEAAIMRHLSVRSCVVVGHGEGLEKRIVAYVVRDVVISDVNRPPLVIQPTGHSPEARKALSAHLAHYMIPSVWIELDALPTHDVSGKIDVRALPTPAPTRPASPTMMSSTSTSSRGGVLDEQTIAEAWAASLALPLDQVVGSQHSFFDLGGHSLSLADLAGRLSKQLGYSVPLAALAAKPSLEGHLAIAQEARNGHIASLKADLPAMLRKDCELPKDISIKRSKPRLLSEAKTVVLTGATGYLGAFLLRTLHERTGATIVCPVRFSSRKAKSDEKEDDDRRPEGIARIRANLVDLGLWHDGLLDRLDVVPANLSAPLLGLSQAEFDDLGHRADVIVHGAATVNLVYPYAALRDTNVGGTREMLRLASIGGATFHHVSSNGALPSQEKPWTEDNSRISLEDAAEKLADGYGQTKWSAEQLVAQARARGMPATVYRLGTLSGSSKTGASNAYDMLNALVVESLRMGCAPEIKDWRIEMTPVDHVAEAIAALADSATTTQKAMYHLVDSNPVSATDLFDRLSKLGYPIKARLSWDAWVLQWRDKTTVTRSSPLASAAKQPFTVDILKGGLPTVEALTSVALLDDAATRSVLEQDHSLLRPKLDDILWQTYLRHFYARGWLSTPPRRILSQQQNVIITSTKPINRRLAGRVAVVTGASSGIGEAVAVALAREGAKVAIAARRKDALEGVKARMESTSQVLIQPTDVTDAAQVESLMQNTRAQLGPIDILVSCAGVMYFTMMGNVKLDEWTRTVDVNCKGLLHCLASTVPPMLARETGHIVAISSDAGRKVFPGLGVYSASKFFVEATLQSLRLETAGTGLRVTSIQPGNVSTELLSMSTDKEALEKYGQPSGAKVLDPTDVAESIVYALCQPPHVAVNEVLIEPRDEPI